MYSKLPKNTPTFSIPRSSKIYPNWYFWFENILSGNPVSQVEVITPVDLSDKYFGGIRYDVMVSFSSLEHSGLGRFRKHYLVTGFSQSQHAVSLQSQGALLNWLQHGIQGQPSMNCFFIHVHQAAFYTKLCSREQAKNGSGFFASVRFFIYNTMEKNRTD
jgi:hypothetical protein